MEQDPQAVASSICQQELLCHCCYDILLDPTTLTCGHSFCRHCLAQWWDSSRKKECPECREKWEGFPKINILLRETTQKLFCADVQRRRAEIQADPNVSQSLLAFQRHGGNSGRSNTSWQRGAKLFLYGAFAAFVCVAVKEVLFSFRRSSLAPDDQRPNKPVPHWTPEEVGSWLDQLGPWTQLYRESFLEHSINGRLLLMLEEEELFSPPFHVLNTAQRRTILAELDQLKSPLTKTPQNLWEYKLEPGWPQWAEFLVMCLLLPYMLIAEFAWSWLSVQYWTSHFIVVNAALLSVLEGFALWRLWNRAEIRTLPRKMWNHSWSMILQGLAFALIWPFVPQFVCNCFFYWALYCSPVVNIDRVVRQLIYPETQ
ncbi:bifunctional apoptosis regulator-like isoform 2-T2 [Synchiropus picturatus]